jgi:IclR family acetate operon transcriptional repressor
VSATEAFFASRSMQALEVLAFGPSTATQVAAELQVHPRTARRLLNRMVHDGWLIRREGARPTYTPTMRIVALAAQLAHRAPLVRHATDVARDLYERVGSPVHVAIPSYRSALRLVRVADRSDGAPALRDLAPAHAIAAGKLLLAFREPWRDVVLDFPLASVTAKTLVDAGRLRAELDETRDRGYALEDEEFRMGARALAVPVRAEGEVVAALAVSSENTSLAELLASSERTRLAAEELSARLALEPA